MAAKKKTKSAKPKEKSLKPKPEPKNVLAKAKASKPEPKKSFFGKIAGVFTKKDSSSLTKIGEVTHYFPHVKAAAVKILKDELRVGDDIHIKGHTTDLKEKIKSIQLDRVTIEAGKKGQEIGLMVKSRVREGDIVFKVK